MDEKILSGYCRVLDQSRMVTLELQNGILEEVDCSFGACLHESGCPIAQKIREYLKSREAAD